MSSSSPAQGSPAPALGRPVDLLWHVVTFRWASRERARRRLRNASWFLAIASGGLIPLSTSAAEIAFGLCALFWYIGGIRERGRSLLWSSPVGVACLALFGWLALSVLWSDGTVADGLRSLVKYRALAYVAILLSRFEDRRLKRLTSNGFVGAMLVTLAASWLMRLGFVQSKWGDAENCAFFKNHIAQNVMMAFAAFLLARSAVTHRPWRWLKLGLAALCAHNVLFMVDGRTGYLIVAVLALFFVCAHLGWRGAVFGGAGLGVAAILVYSASSGLRSRVDLAFTEAASYFDGQPVGEMNSIGQRLQFYETSLAVAAERPIFGHGTGGFEPAYRKVAEARGIVPTRNPHNEYLMTLIQGGVVGLVLLVTLFVVQWRTAATLPEGRSTIARALVLTIAIGCLFNSFLMDKTESSFFAIFSAICFAAPPSRESDRGPAYLPGRDSK